MNKLKQQLKELEVEHIFKQERIKDELEHEIKQTLGLDCSYISTTPCIINGVSVHLCEAHVRMLQIMARRAFVTGGQAAFDDFCSNHMVFSAGAEWKLMKFRTDGKFENEFEDKWFETNALLAYEIF